MDSSNLNVVTEERFDLVEFFDDLIEAEAGVFRLSDWGRHSIVYSRPSPQHVRALQENGYGLHILKHGRCTEDIHNYFRNYESYKCCLGLVGGQNVRTRLRLVKSESISQNSLDIGVDVTSPTSAYAAPVDLRLSDEEYRAFKCALWCAICPLLTAQKPPDDSSPPLTPSEHHQHEYDFEVQRRRKVSHSRTRQYSATMVESNIRDASLISSDIMREVLRRAFGLDRHLELYYLKLAYKFHKTKNDAQILAEDLCYQLSLLEKDAHPYYRSTSFLSQYAYNLWRLSKRRHIMELMNKFWCNALPPVGDVEKFEACSIHSDYRLLLHKLLRQQKLQYCKDPGKVAFAIVPSGAARKILTEFSLRYGIDDLYHLTTYLEYLILNFEIEKDFIELVTETVQNILSILPSEKATALLVQQQVEQLESCINRLLHRCEHLFSHVQTVFASTNSCDSIDSLLQLLEKTVMLRDYLVAASDNPVPNAGELLQGYLEVNFQLIYIEHKTSALSDANSRGESCQLSPRVINRIMLCLRDDLTEYHNNYQRVFERYFNITELSSIALYEFLMKDVLELCQQMKTQNEMQKVNFGMVGLIYRLNALDNDLKEFILVNRQTWRQACVDLVLRWFSALYRKGEYFILSAVGQDQFIPLSIPRKFISNKEGIKRISDNSASPPLFIRSGASAFSIVNGCPHNEASTESQDFAADGQSAAPPLADQPLSSDVCVHGTNASSSCEIDGSDVVDKSKTAVLQGDMCSVESIISQNSEEAAFNPTNANVPSAIEARNSTADALDAAAAVPIADASKDLKSVMIESNKCANGDDVREVLTGGSESESIVVSGVGLSVSPVAKSVLTMPSKLPAEASLPSVSSSFGKITSTSDDDDVPASDAVESSVVKASGSLIVSSPALPDLASEASVISATDSSVKLDCDNSSEISSDVHVISAQLVNANSASSNAKEQSPSSDMHSTKEDELGGKTVESLGNSEQPNSRIVQSLESEERAAADVKEPLERSPGVSEKRVWSSDSEENGCRVNLPDAGDLSIENREQAGFTSEESNINRKASNGAEMASNGVRLPDVADDSLSSESSGTIRSDEEDTDGTRSSSCNNDSGSLPKLKLVGHLREGESCDPVASSDAVPLPLPRPAHLLKTDELDSQYSALRQSRPVPYGESLERGLSSADETKNRSDEQSCSSAAARVSRRSDGVIRTGSLVTSSLVDVTCLIQRLICVSETLGVALYRPALSSSRGSCGVDAAEYKMDELWINLKKHLEKMIHDLIILYAKNLLAMDLCAVSQKIATELTGSQLVQDLIRSHDSIWGCRHKLSGSDCLRYVNRHEEFRDSRHEPLSKAMCFRINNLLQLRKMLPAFFRKSAFCNVGDITSSFSVAEDYLNAAITGLINIFVYRMQLFVIDFLTQLVISQLPSRAELEMTLQPLTGFLTSHLTSIQRWLCPENYFALQDRLWLSLSWCFEKCTRDVIRNPSPLSDQHADRLMQTIVVIHKEQYGVYTSINCMCNKYSISIVMRLIVKLNHTNPDNIKVKHLDAVLFWLQMYSQPTHRLISIYQLLCLKKIVWNGDYYLPYGCELGTFEKMRYDLHSSRKCFQGQQLIDWISNHPHSFLTANDRSRQSSDDAVCDTDDSIPSGIREAALHSPYDLAQALLDTGAVQQLDFSSPLSCYSSSSITSDPYPRLVFHGTVRQTQSSNASPSQALLSDDEMAENLHSTVLENTSPAEAQALQQDRQSSEDQASALLTASSMPSPQKCSTSYSGESEAIDRDLTGSNGDACPAEEPSQECSSETLRESSPDLSPVNVPGSSSLTFYATGWYQIPSPSEAVTMIDPVEAMSQGRLREVHQCLQFFIAKRVKKETILSIVVSRKKHDELAKQFVRSLPRDVICKYPWLYIKEQTVLACLGLLV